MHFTQLSPFCLELSVDSCMYRQVWGAGEDFLYKLGCSFQSMILTSYIFRQASFDTSGSLLISHLTNSQAKLFAPSGLSTTWPDNTTKATTSSPVTDPQRPNARLLRRNQRAAPTASANPCPYSKPSRTCLQTSVTVAHSPITLSTRLSSHKVRTSPSHMQGKILSSSHIHAG